MKLITKKVTIKDNVKISKYCLFGCIPYSVKKDSITVINNDDVKISKYYLLGCIPYCVKEDSPEGKKTFLFNKCIFHQKKNLPYIKNALNIKEIFQKELKNINRNGYQIDIVIPIYNGYDFLDDLFTSIEKNTDLPFRMFVVNDCSTDERIKPLLENWNKKFGLKMVLIENETNLGFVKSVNRALKQTDNDVVLVNSDVVFPENWAGRLFYPIVHETNIASATPFSNSATIFSLPKFCQDNDFDGDMESVNSLLQFINTPYQTIKVPTGVGFCMAMSRKAINDVGFLDEIFGRGYGEENDWCQRAIKKGYINTIAADLFVWHKHGGTFISEEKAALIKKHLSIISDRYPHYGRDVQATIKDESFLSLRFIAELFYFSALAEKCEIWFDLAVGGGAETYAKRQFDKLKTDTLCVRIQNSARADNTCLSFVYKEFSNSIKLHWDDAILLVSHLKANKIVLNSLVFYFDSIAVLKQIVALKKVFNTNISFRGHDFFAICPTINMINANNAYCHADTFDKCSTCFSHLDEKKYQNIHCSVKMWQDCWNNFLSHDADEILLFSKSSADIFIKYYPDTKNKIQIIPHDVPQLRPVNIPEHKGINIGVLGNINVAKGLNVLREIDSEIKKYKGINVIVIGNVENDLSHIRATRGYDLNSLPDIMEKEKIDVIFISSIWPETFSYTTSEAISMGLPVVCYQLGAQAEKISNYEKGLVLTEINPVKNLNDIINFVTELKKKS